MAWLILLHGVVALAVVPCARVLAHRVFWLAAVAPAAAFAWLLAHASEALDGGLSESFEWVAALGLDIDLRLGGMGLLMGLIISGIGVLVMLYSSWYFGDHEDAARAAALLVTFAGAMLGVVWADNVFVLFVFWELTTVTSYLLIGLEDRKAAARASAQQAFQITGIGGLAMLAGLVLLGQAGGTWSISGLLADPPAGGVVPAALGLILVGAFTKSAQVPFHFWLPGAMAAPTPISTYLHSATMVKAGVYLVAVLAPAFAPTVGWWRPVVMGVGLATMLWGGGRALRQHDLKLLAAHGTVSQLGFMMILVGAGIPALTFAGCAVILAHALFKAALFMVVGVVDHATGTRDIRHLRGLGPRMPVLAAIAAVSAASMAGIPLLFGFVAKETALEGLIGQTGSWAWGVATAGVVVGSALTVAYAARFVFGGFGSWTTTVGSDTPVDEPARATQPGGHAGPDGHGSAPDHEHRHPGLWALGPPGLLAALTLVLGIFPGLADSLVSGAAEALDASGTAVDEHLALWHGFTAALGLSALAIAGGLVLIVVRRRVERVQQRLGGFPGSFQVYGWALRSTLHWADRITGVVQNGSLPVYLTIILLTAVALPASALVQVRGLDLSVQLAENPVQALVSAVVVVAAIATAFARRRFAAVMLMGAVGYGVTVLFVIQGAPDLALTQLLVETLTLVMFVLVLRHLPDRFRPVSRGSLAKGGQIALAVAVGVGVSVFALLAASSRSVPPVSEEQIALAKPEGGGSNVVNVILVDIRGLDTLGEITVLVTAALGVATLTAAARRHRNDRPGSTLDGAPDLPAAPVREEVSTGGQA